LDQTRCIDVGETRRVIRPETAATLRRLMEGVVLNGTGTLARLDGWTAAGKTGSAQKIDPATGRYSPTQLIASFTGFAANQHPAVTILGFAGLSCGLARRRASGRAGVQAYCRAGAGVHGRAARCAAEPETDPGRIQAADANQAEALEDFSATDFSGQPDEPPAASNPVAPISLHRTLQK